MERTSPSFEVQDQSDRLISMLAWVVVAILVLYASVFFYRQATGHGVKGTIPSALAQSATSGGSTAAGLTGAPGNSPTLTSSEALSAPPVALTAPGASTAQTGSAPIHLSAMATHAAGPGPDDQAPLTHALATADHRRGGDAAAGVATLGKTVAGFAVHLGPYGSWDQVFEKAKSIDTTAHLIQIAEEDQGFAILLGHLPTVEDASALAAKMTAQGMHAKVVPWRDTALDRPAAHRTAPTITVPETAQISAAKVNNGQAGGKSQAGEESSPTLSTAQTAQGTTAADSGSKPETPSTGSDAQAASKPAQDEHKDSGRSTGPEAASTHGNASNGAAATGTAAIPAHDKVTRDKAAHDKSTHDKSAQATATKPAAKVKKPAATPAAGDEAADTSAAREPGGTPLARHAIASTGGSEDADSADGASQARPKLATEGADISAAADSPDSGPAPGGDLAIQAGKFTDRDSAFRLARRLKAKGWETHVERVSPEDTDPYFRVRVGSYADDARARKDAVRVAHDAGVNRVAIIRE